MRVLYQTDDVKNKRFSALRGNFDYRNQAYGTLNGLVSVGEFFSASWVGNLARKTHHFLGTTIPKYHEEINRDGDALKANPISAERWLNEVKLLRDQVKDTYSFGVTLEIISRITSFLTQMKKVWVGPYGVRAVVFDKPRKRVLDSVLHGIDLNEVKPKVFHVDLDAMPGTQRDKLLELMSAKDHQALKQHEIPLDLRRALNRATKSGSAIILSCNSEAARAICEANMKKLSANVWIVANNGNFVAGPTENGRLKVLRDDVLDKGFVDTALNIVKSDDSDEEGKFFDTTINVELTTNDGKNVEAEAKLTWDVCLVNNKGELSVVELDKLENVSLKEDGKWQSVTFKPRLTNIFDLMEKKGAPLWQNEIDDILAKVSCAGCASFIGSKVDKKVAFPEASLQPRSDGGFGVLKAGVSSMQTVDKIAQALGEDICSIVGTTEAICEPISLEYGEDLFLAYKQKKQKNSKQLANDMYLWGLLNQANKVPINLLTKEETLDGDKKRTLIDNKRLCLTGECGVAKKKLGSSLFNLLFNLSGSKVRTSVEKKTGDAYSMTNIASDGVKFVAQSLLKGK